MSNMLGFKRRVLSSCIAACTAATMSTNVLAQGVEEELVVTGIRAAQATSVNIKRDAVSVVDAISAEDIGKLPDVTITDSLQRITGVQIRRSAGEGSSLNIRGLPQVLTTMNGESYLGANSITTTQPNFTDIPSQLFAGAAVIKSQTATTNAGGISGVVDLKTWRPFGFDEGTTLSGAVQAGYGADSQETDPSVNGLFNWRNDQVGFLAAVTYSEANLANYYAGLANGGSDAGWTGAPHESWWGEDVNGDGDIDDGFVAFQGHSAYNRFVERERLGANLAFEADLGGGFDFIAEAFFTDLEEYDRIMGVTHSDKWQRWNWFFPTQTTEHAEAQLGGGTWNSTQEYTGNGRRFKSYSSVAATESSSENYNLEMNYDNDGAFTGSLRYVRGRATQDRMNSYIDIDVANGNQWGVETQNYPSGPAATNPNGYAGFPTLTVNYAGDPTWSGFENNANLDLDGNQVAETQNVSLATYLADVNSYSVGALTSENNYNREGESDVLRFDGNFAFDDGVIDSIDFGARFSNREMTNSEFELLSPIGNDGEECGVKWKATDVTMNGGGIPGACTFGDGGDPETFYVAGVPTPISTLGAVQVSDFGSVNGIPSIWTVDPSRMDDVMGFHSAQYPGTYRNENPGNSYQVALQELSYFAQANFSKGDFSGNFGVRVVQSDLSVTRNKVGVPQPYGASNQDVGDEVTERAFVDVLPSLNLRYDFSDDLVLRAAASKTMAPLDLNQWGSGLIPSYTIDSDPASETYNQFIVQGASDNGNPNLNPWRATNMELSLEYYIGTASMLNAGVFQIDMESFLMGNTEMRALPDQDGTVRREVPVTFNSQGEGGEISGVELSAKLAMSDLTDGFFGGFGLDLNYTYAPSDSGTKDQKGDDLPFEDNSEVIYNVVAWYEDGPIQARIAYNYRDDRLVLQNQVWGNANLWQDATAYVDASFAYDITDEINIFINASNLTGEKEEYYLEYEDQFAFQFEYEPRYTLGVRATF